MRHLTIHLAIALAMFTIGTTITRFPPLAGHSEVRSMKSLMSRPAEEDELVLRVFEIQIEPHSSYPQPTYYLSCYNYLDPSDKIISHLVNNRPLRVKKLSELGQDFESHPARRIFVRVGSLRWISDTEVIVGGSCTADLERSLAHLYHFVREAGGWRLVSSETIT